MNASSIMKKIVDEACDGARQLAVMPSAVKNKVLLEMAENIDAKRTLIKQANQKDIVKAESNKKNKAFIDRLRLDDNRIDSMCLMMKEVAALNDPVGGILNEFKRPNGLVIKKIRVPIGVIGIIYESRPNVTADCVALCFKSGNAVILRGGSDAVNSNKAIYNVLKEASENNGLKKGAFILIEDTSRELVDAMLTVSEGIDLIMPRGGESLIREVVSKSRVPVIKHYKGICHVYVDVHADLNMAETICINAKIQRPGVCNAMETMLVHKDVAETFLPTIAEKLKQAGVRLKGCARTLKILKNIEKAEDKDFSEEWLDLVLNIRVVNSLDEAVDHISKFGSKHSDAIVTENETNAKKFTDEVDSAAVYVNASTRFTDGGQFGLGAEIGISTDKIHARGPMGLEELCSYKYVVYGKGQVRNG
ncbi:MAG: glutamate-5-semialdehyde dehydrogenase [Candidatus Omnitrophota bacterium]